MDEKTFKKYKNARSNLRGAAFLLILGAALDGSVGYLLLTQGEQPYARQIGILVVLLVAAELIAAIGLLTWKPWGRVLTMVLVGFGLLMQLPQFPRTIFPVLIRVFIIAVLSNAKTREVNRYRGNLEALRNAHEVDDVFD